MLGPVLSRTVRVSSSRVSAAPPDRASAAAAAIASTSAGVAPEARCQLPFSQ